MNLKLINNIIHTKSERLTSPFGRRADPISGLAGVQHNGVDIVDSQGRQRNQDVWCLAIADGVVTDVHNGIEIGHGVDILHENRILSRQYHFRTFPNLRAGDKVSKGQRIGIMGTTGRSTGVHLHFEIKENSTRWNNGISVDPMPYLMDTKKIISVIPNMPAQNTARKSIDEIAIEAIRGLWGNGIDRQNRLNQSGYNFIEVQARVNQILKGAAK